MSNAIPLVVMDNPAITMAVQDGVVRYVDNYEELLNKPKINGVELVGNKTTAQLIPDGVIIDGGNAEWVTGR